MLIIFFVVSSVTTLMVSAMLMQWYGNKRYRLGQSLGRMKGYSEGYGEGYADAKSGKPYRASRTWSSGDLQE